ncbi:hypothetical protein MB02_07565 [Croceicoccus estronivorus]|uniref:MFS transporter n=1 Tax=Croceicoccus estronivorus TaxID=1172626 RepID=UPI00083061AF|nr:MFS transporter [Croceicoccus estronivorus]OCC24426.1 hypothetical protein MB02_07565 [Croceicoccus estronivorus]
MRSSETMSGTTDETICQRIDSLPLRGVLLRVPIFCTLLMVFEGMDNNVISYVGPLIRDEFNLSAPVLGMIYAATVVASLIGAVGVAPLSDRLGRRPVLLLSNLVMVLCTLVTPLIDTAWGLMIVRFVVGLAFGAAVPTTFALAADFAPKKYRALLIMIVTAGVALGYVFSGFTSAAIIPHFGWRVLMFSLAAISALWAVLIYLMLPESPQFLVRNRRNEPQTVTSLGQIGLSLDDLPADAGKVGGVAQKVSPLLLLSPTYRATTLMTLFVVCSIYAVELLMAYWLPTMLMNQGFAIGSAASIAAIGKIASIIGCIVIGWQMDRRGLVTVLSIAFFCGSLAFGLLAVGFSMPLLILPSVMCMFFFVDGAFSGSQALTVTSYPPHMRATASGWITGISRLVGGGVGTLAGGALIGAGFTMPAIAILLLAVMMVAGGMLVLLGRYRAHAWLAMGKPLEQKTA